MELSKRPNNSQRDCAVLITDQPVIPAFKITENTFIEVVSDINDVNLTKCFIQASNTSTMSFYDCHLENAGTLSNTDRFFECSVDGGQKDVSIRLNNFQNNSYSVCRLLCFKRKSFFLRLSRKCCSLF